MKNFFKTFFSSLWNDIKTLAKQHIFKLIAFVIMFVVPLIVLCVGLAYKKPESWGVPIFAYPCIVVFIIVYWAKFRSFMSVKVETMRIKNSLDQGKYFALIMLTTLLNCVMTVLPFIFGWCVFNYLEGAAISIKDCFAFLICTESVGSIFILIDVYRNTTKPVSTTDEVENKEEKKEE